MHYYGHLIKNLRQYSLSNFMQWTGCERSGQQNQQQHQQPAVKCENPDGPAGWATCFEKLLEDPLGLHTFAEFLKKEFSAENIYFWTACERYRRLPTTQERRTEADRIYRQHLCTGAPEAVNVDAHGRHCTERSLRDAEPTLFDQPQKQIFNLMKFDSYPRFLKSQMYKECLAGVAARLDFDPGLALQPKVETSPKLKKSMSNAEERSTRKSLLRWHKKNSRSKSKDRGDAEVGQKSFDGASSCEGGGCEGGGCPTRKNGFGDIHSSRSSLTSLDLAVSAQESLKNGEELSASSSRSALCRVILSNGSTTVVQIKEAESIQHLVKRLLEKRGLNYSSFEVYTDKHSKALDVNEPSSKLAGCEVTVEQRVVFKLDLPNRKVISVKSKYTKIIMDVLRPILHKYNYNLDEVKVSKSSNEIVQLNQPVTTIDNLRLNVQLCDDLENHSSTNNPTLKASNSKPNKLEEITNQVFEGILQEKADAAQVKPKSDKGSVKSEDWGSDSSGILGKFLRRDSAAQEKKKKSLLPRSKTSSNNGSSEDVNNEHGHVKKPLIAKLKAGVNKFQVTCSESDELVEGLTRAQRSRLEDQRGTEINFELPDFLKDKEGDQKPQRRSSETDNTHFSTPKTERLQGTSSAKNLKLDLRTSSYENSSVLPGISSSQSQSNIQPSCSSQKLSNLRVYSPTKSAEGSKSVSCSSSLKTPSPADCKKAESGESLRLSDPPPLPPKPKIIPIKPSNWGQSGLFANKDMPTVHDRSKNTVFLDQPSSSFV